MKTKVTAFSLCILLLITTFCSCSTTTEESETTLDLSNIPDFSGDAYVEINNNEPYFTEDDYTTTSFEEYDDLDDLGRCTLAYACIGSDLMPTEERGSIGQVKPSGWNYAKYDCVDGKYLYNRCHLIGYQLTAENANECNLITGTRYLNIEGMLPFENLTADYIEETDNHVLYRVTPIFEDDNLLAKGVLMEGKSVEDDGEGVCFNVFCYNSQPEIEIDYSDGSSKYVGSSTQSTAATTASKATSASKITTNSKTTYILNNGTKKIHTSSCKFAKSISAKNKSTYSGDIDDLIEQGYERCKVCNPE